MCLAIPVRILSREGDTAVGTVGGVEREVSVMMTPEAGVGDYVIVHAGFAIQVVDQREAEENLRIFAEMARAVDDAKTRAARGRSDRRAG
jgi:hydrogenase expression/formation protein HypC